MVKIDGNTPLTTINDYHDKLINGNYTINKYIPNEVLNNSQATNINIAWPNPFWTNNGANIIAGKHSIKSAGLNSSIYAANTAYNELTDKSITQHPGLMNELTNSRTTNFSSRSNSGIGYSRSAMWVGYFRPDKKGTYTFTASNNLTLWIGDYALWLYSDNNSNINSNQPSFSYLVTDYDLANKYVPIRIQLNGTDNFNLSCSSQLFSFQNNFVSLYKNGSFFYRNQIIFTLKKNGNDQNDNNFDMYIFANSIDTTKKSVSMKYVRVVGDNMNNYPQIETTKYNRYYNNDCTLNIAKGNPLMNRLTLNDPTDSTYLISDKNGIFNYNARVTYNTFNQAFPENPTDPDGYYTQSDCHSACSGNSNCQGYYYSWDNESFPYCTLVNSDQKNLTYLPQQPGSTLIKSTLYTKNPSILDIPNTHTSFLIKNQVSDYTGITLPYDTYTDTTIPSPTEIKKVNDTLQTISNKLSGVTRKAVNTKEPFNHGNRNAVKKPENLPPRHANPVIPREKGPTPISAVAFNTVINPPDEPYDTNVRLILKYRFDKRSVRNTSSHRGIPNTSITIPSTVIDNGKTVAKIPINNRIQLPNFSMTKKYFSGDITKSFSISIKYKLNIVSTQSYHIWSLMSFSGDKEFIQIFISYWNNIYYLNCFIKIHNDPYHYFNWVIPPELVNSRNRVTACFNAENSFKCLFNKQVVIDSKKNRETVLYPDISTFSYNMLGENNIWHLGKWSQNWSSLWWRWFWWGGRYHYAERPKFDLKNSASTPPGWKLMYKYELHRRYYDFAYYSGNFSTQWEWVQRHSNDHLLITEFDLYNEDVSLDQNVLKEFFSSMNINNMNSSPYIIEGLDNPMSVDNVGTNFSSTMDGLKSNSKNYDINFTNVNNNIVDLSNNLKNYNSLIKKQSDNTKDGNYSVKQGVIYDIDSTGNIIAKNSNPTSDVIQDDLNQLILQQNTIYITGTIACATLLIAAIMIGSK